MNIQLLRNATQVLYVNGKTILIDPMLAPKGSYPPFKFTTNDRKNPITDLPVTDKELTALIKMIDAVLLTHLHLDHWDIAAQQLIPKDKLIFCQPTDIETIRSSGFTNIVAVNQEILWNDVIITRTGGRHGTGETQKRMGIVSGYMIRHKNDILYIAGDTIWCDEVKDAIHHHKPSRIIINGGGARFITGDPIVMDIKDVISVCRFAPDAKVYVVHLEAVNHGVESRAFIRAELQQNELCHQCFVPEDGERFI